MGRNFRDALSAGEVRPAFQISRTMFCAAPFKPLHRQLAEMRTAARIERHYSRPELFTIYANRTYFGGDQIGVQSAPLYFFHKNLGDLNIAEAALLAGLARGPSYLRREVIDAMRQTGTIPASKAEAAKTAPLGIVANHDASKAG